MYYQYQISTTPDLSELVLAFLQQLPFESFEETDYGWNAYIPSANLPDSMEMDLNVIRQKVSFTFEKAEIPDQNWNAVWESNFEPIIIDHFCGIRADFHPPIPDVLHEIVINPKMAFGTGHHETTYMMIQQMQGLDFAQKKVLDFGCGTGILAILASRLGASEIIGVEIEKPAFDNAIENITTNQTSNVKCIHGTLKNITESGYDIILANINRNVILTSLSSLYEKLNEGGILLVSGFLLADRELLLEHAGLQGFKMKKETQKHHWICIAFIK